MEEREQDKLLGIKTVGTREWPDNKKIHYYRYEATPYKALHALSENYKFKDADTIVDFGCGRGRVAFYLHNRFHLPVVGVEADFRTYREAIENKIMYRLKTRNIAAPVKFKYGLAQHYKIDKKDNCFYFFNPFSIPIFRKVIYNILRSVEKDRRNEDLILYYPMQEYEIFLEIGTPFEIIDKIRVPGENDEREKFIIYQLREQLY
ncbi:MAG: SAM-dependent methyltransferase [Clostridiaceae bacterium]|nr:SAM-dependent methyltransferase [Clostridiaceae bacterium]